MATDYTANYNLDKYTANDKPNLRDQYNAAMDKIDAQLLIGNNNASLAAQAAQAAVQAAQAAQQDVSGKASQSELNALKALLPSTEFSTSHTVKDAIDAISGQTSTKYFGVIGDSFSDEYNASFDEWPAIVSNKTGMPRINKATGGSGWKITAGANRKTFLTQLQEMHADPHWNDLQHIIVYGCVNDWMSQHETAAETNQLIDDFLTEFRSYSYRPKLTLVLGNVGAPDRIYNTNQTYYGYPRYITDVVRHVINAGYDAIPAFAWLLGNYDTNVFTSDTLHPNDRGSNIIAGFMTQILHGTYTGFLRRVTLSSPVSGYNGNLTMNIYDTFCNISFLVETQQAISNVTGTVNIFNNVPKTCFGPIASQNPYYVGGGSHTAGYIYQRMLSEGFQSVSSRINPYDGTAGFMVEGQPFNAPANLKIYGERTFPIV